jgi:hypothetical protein
MNFHLKPGIYNISDLSTICHGMSLTTAKSYVIFKIVYFEPNSGLKLEYRALGLKNRRSLIHQLNYILTMKISGS